MANRLAGPVIAWWLSGMRTLCMQSAPMLPVRRSDSTSVCARDGVDSSGSVCAPKRRRQRR